MKTANRMMSPKFGAATLKSYLTLASVALVVKATSLAAARLLNPGIFPPTSSPWGNSSRGTKSKAMKTESQHTEHQMCLKNGGSL